MKQHDDLDQPGELKQHEESFEELERYLSGAMRRVDVPEGFAERVMARATAAPARGKVLTMPSRMRAWVGGAIAAALLAGVFVGEEVHVRRQRAEAEAAQKQFEAGMRITDAALEHTREQLRSAGVLIGD